MVETSSSTDAPFENLTEDQLTQADEVLKQYALLLWRIAGTIASDPARYVDFVERVKERQEVRE